MGWRNMRKKNRQNLGILISHLYPYEMQKYINKICLSCLVSEIQLFVYIFGQNSKWPPAVSYYKKVFLVLKFIKVKIEMPMIFLVTFVTINQQTAGLGKKYYSLEWLPYQDKCVDGPNIYESLTGTNLGPQTCFVNKQLSDISKKLSSFGFLTWFWTGYVKQTFSEILSKIERVLFEIIKKECQLFVYKKCPRNKKFLFLIRFWRNFVRL